MIVQRLKPWVTSFSEAIRMMGKHGDTVCIGGEIKEILNIGQMLSEVEKSEDTKDFIEGVYITLDDGVGTNRVIMPTNVFDTYNASHGLEVGKLVLAEGRVFNLDIKHRNKVVKHHTEHTTSILCWKMTPLPEQENKEEE